MAKKKKTNESKNPYIQLLPSTGGRPRKTLTEAGWKQVATLSQFMATEEEIADALSDENESISVDVLTNAYNKASFAENKRKGQSRGRTSLRSWQFQAAKNGNTSLLIFLGKNYLKQSDKAEYEVKDTQININVSPATEADIEEE